MYRILFPVIAINLALLAGGPPVSAAPHEHADTHAAEHNKADAVRSSDVYPLTADPLGDPLAEVEKPVVLDYEGRNLHFASEANAEAFKADPDKYIPVVDQMIIEQQKSAYPMSTCVVSGEKLGDMGEPIDYVYGNRLVRFCCKMCKADFNKDPNAYMAKINAAVVESQKTEYPMDTCIISGDKLGGDMGEPIDYVIGGRLVELCCPMCIKKFEVNPAQYLSILETHDAHEQGESGMQGDHGHEGHHEATRPHGDTGHDAHSHGEHH